MTADVLDFQPGAVLEGTPYRVVRRIGAGGMGAVFEVEHVRLKKRLMVKTLHPGLRARQDFVTRMEVEAQTLARIAHPNIVQVHDLGVTVDGIPFFVMEKLEGSDLRKLLRARRYLDLPDALTIVEDVLEALAHAHREGVIHRDIKPENIFLARSGAETVTKILDFGIVHVLDDSKNLTGERFLGTCQYAAPEQLQGQKPSEKTDIYAVGCMLFELITGRRPFLGPTSRDFIGQHLHTEAPRLATIAPGVSPELDALVASALEKDPAKRPVGALWFASQLHRIQLSAARVVLAEANTTEEMLLTAITEGAASSNPLVAAAADARDTDRDPRLAVGLRETTPEPRGARGGDDTVEQHRGGTLPMRPEPSPEDEFRRARTRTGKPVAIVRTEELSAAEQQDGGPRRVRSDQPAEVQRARGPALPALHASSVVLPMRSLVPKGIWGRRAIIASPVVVGAIIATVILVKGPREDQAAEPAPSASTVTTARAVVVPPTASAQALSAVPVEMPSRATETAPAGVAAQPPREKASAAVAQPRSSSASKVLPRATVQAPERTMGSPAAAPTLIPTAPAAPSQAPPRPPPSDDMVRTF